jgi:hypothetical protein
VKSVRQDSARSMGLNRAGVQSRPHAGPLGSALTALLLFTLVGEPAPTSVGPAEVGMVLLALGVVVAAALRVVGVQRLALERSYQALGVILASYAALLVVSVVVGGIHTTPSAATFRAIAPYLLFLPLAAALPLLDRGQLARSVPGALATVGVIQSLYLIGLFFVAVPDFSNVGSVFLGRITFLDDRTTVPLFLAAVILPLAMVGTGYGRTLLAVLAVAAGTTAGLATQTRAQLVALAVGGCSFLMLRIVIRFRATPRAGARSIRRGVLLAGAVGILGAGVLAFVPPWSALTRSVALRISTASDNSRLDDEWAPAVRRVLDDPLSIAVGIGAGESFITGAGEERTYVHNMVIYVLLYHGLIGLLVVGAFYGVVLILLTRRALAEASPLYAALAALLVAMLVYAQFFAVHKLFSYNAMLALIAAAGLARPAAKPA